MPDYIKIDVERTEDKLFKGGHEFFETKIKSTAGKYLKEILHLLQFFKERNLKSMIKVLVMQIIYIKGKLMLIKDLKFKKIFTYKIWL